jgi:4-hydroxybenzoate polyprenyltransferase
MKKSMYKGLPWKKIIDFYLYGSIHISLGAALMSVMSLRLLDYGIGKQLPYLFSIYFATQTFYSIHRIYDVESIRKLSESSKYKVITGLQRSIYISLLISAFFTGFSILFIPFEIIVVLLLGALFTAWYSQPVALISRKKLREFPHIKIFIIALIWGLVTAAIPAYLAGREPTVILLMFLERSVFILALTLPFDVRDYLIDKRQEVKTLPAWMGKKVSLIVAVILLVIVVNTLVLGLHLLSIYSWRSMALLISTNILSSLFVAFSNKVNSDYYYTGVLDGILIFQPLILLIFN